MNIALTWCLGWHGCRSVAVVGCFHVYNNSLGNFPEANCGLDRSNRDYEFISDLGEKFYPGDSPNFVTVGFDRQTRIYPLAIPT
jgi:hypothetical protein